MCKYNKNIFISLFFSYALVDFGLAQVAPVSLYPANKNRDNKILNKENHMSTPTMKKGNFPTKPLSPSQIGNRMKEPVCLFFISS